MTEETKEMVEAQSRAPIKASLASKGGLIPTNFEELYRLAHVMAASGMMPKGIETAAKVFVAVQNGLEVGLSPMQAVQNTAVINGRATIYGDAALGLIRASGLLEEFKEWFSGQDDNLTAHCHVKRKGEPDPAIGLFSVADAKLAKLYPGDPLSPWAKYPKRMLQWRARTWPLRDKFADVLRGLRITEEAIDLKEVENGSFGIEEIATLPEDFNSIVVPDKNGEVHPDAHEDFDEKVPKEAKADRVKEFLALVQQSAEKTLYEIKQEAFEHWDEFWASFLKWQDKKYADKPKPSEKDPIREQYINLRGAGFSTWVHNHTSHIIDLDSNYQDEIKAKWKKLYPDEPYPVYEEEKLATDEIAVPVDENEGTDLGSPSLEDQAILSLIEGSKHDIAGRLCVPCPGQDGRAILFSYCQEGCQERQGCPTFEEYDKK